MLVFRDSDVGPELLTSQEFIWYNKSVYETASWPIRFNSLGTEAAVIVPTASDSEDYKGVFGNLSWSFYDQLVVCKISIEHIKDGAIITKTETPYSTGLVEYTQSYSATGENRVVTIIVGGSGQPVKFFEKDYLSEDTSSIRFLSPSKNRIPIALNYNTTDELSYLYADLDTVEKAQGGTVTATRRVDMREFFNDGIDFIVDYTEDFNVTGVSESSAGDISTFLFVDPLNIRTVEAYVKSISTVDRVIYERDPTWTGIIGTTTYTQAITRDASTTRPARFSNDITGYDTTTQERVGNIIADGSKIKKRENLTFKHIDLNDNYYVISKIGLENDYYATTNKYELNSVFGEATEIFSAVNTINYTGNGNSSTDAESSTTVTGTATFKNGVDARLYSTDGEEVTEFFHDISDNNKTVPVDNELFYPGTSNLYNPDVYGISAFAKFTGAFDPNIIAQAYSAGFTTPQVFKTPKKFYLNFLFKLFSVEAPLSYSYCKDPRIEERKVWAHSYEVDYEILVPYGSSFDDVYADPIIIKSQKAEASFGSLNQHVFLLDADGNITDQPVTDPTLTVYPIGLY
jgi:hypothetical protein